MAPLHQQLENYTEAAVCLKKVIGEETEEILKVGLLTKVAGNFKKAGKEEDCIQTSQAAYDLMKSLSGGKDPQTCRCKLNLAQVYHHFEKYDLAKVLYQEYIDLFASQNGEEGTQDWSKNDTYCKL